MTSRRSFLALLAASLAVKPDALIATPDIPDVPPPERKESLNPILDQWWNHWTITDAVTIRPGAPVDEILFSAPIPANFAIRGISWGIEPIISLRDMQAILETLECALECDSLRYLAGRVAWLPSGFSYSPPYPILPQIVPRESVNLLVNGDSDVKQPATVHFALHGICRMPEVAA